MALARSILWKRPTAEVQGLRSPRALPQRRCVPALRVRPQVKPNDQANPSPVATDLISETAADGGSAGFCLLGGGLELIP